MKFKWNANFQEKVLEDLGIPHEAVLFLKIMQIRDYRFSASSFGRDYFWIGRLKRGWQSRVFKNENTLVIPLVCR